MGYKKSFNLVTLQLIIPLSTMTKAEYKNAYGINLDDIDIEKVTLLQDEGSKNKYFVDEIKTTENGVDIYAGGNILSIGSSVSVVKNAYSVDNAKPIYCHPISIIANEGTYASTRMIILFFDNDSTPYNKTSLASLIDDFVGRLSVNGFFKKGASFGPTSYVGGDNVVYQLSTGEVAFENLVTIINDENVTIDDNVNKIN